MYLDNQQVHNSNGLYAHEALIYNELNESTRNIERILACHGNEFKKEQIGYEESLFMDREEEFLQKNGSTY